MSKAEQERLKVMRTALDKLESVAGRQYNAPSLRKFAGIWTTAGGVVLPVKEMDDKHLKNAIRMLETFFWTHFVKYPDLIEEAARRKRRLPAVGLNTGPSRNEEVRLKQEEAIGLLRSKGPFIREPVGTEVECVDCARPVVVKRDTPLPYQCNECFIVQKEKEYDAMVTDEVEGFAQGCDRYGSLSGCDDDDQENPHS